MTKRSYGLILSSYYRHDCHRVDASLIVREGESDSPINPRGEGEDAIWDAPKHLDGLMLAGFGMHGFVSDLSGEPYIGYEPEFRDIYSVDWRKANRMLATFKRVHRQTEKDEPRDPGDMFMSLARALKLEFVVWSVGDTIRSTYSDNEWNWRTINEGRNHYRHLIDKAREAAKARRAA